MELVVPGLPAPRDPVTEVMAGQAVLGVPVARAGRPSVAAFRQRILCSQLTAAQPHRIPSWEARVVRVASVVRVPMGLRWVASEAQAVMAVYPGSAALAERHLEVASQRRI